MKRFSLAVLGLLALTVSPLCAQDKAPIIVLDNPTKNYGTIAEGETLKQVFRFTNKGNATLEIIKVEPS